MTYMTAGIRVLYPSGSGSLGGASYARSSMKILGQNNLGAQYSGIGSKNKGDIWNMIRKNTALLSRSRTNYSDVDYQVQTGTLTLTDASFARKRSYIVIGADIHITGNIAQRDTPLAIIALADASGSGGNITIDPSITDIDASLFAEHAVSSSGDRQLYIHGSLISANTAGDAVAKICPYYVTAICDEAEAKKYDLEYIRPDFDPSLSMKSLSTTALANQ